MVKTTVLKNFDFASLTDKGHVRERNEDSIAYFDSINGHVFIVCDGMGGHSSGDVASELAVESVKNHLNEKYFPNPFDAIENAIIHSNKEIYTRALGNDYLHGMGTTIVLVLIRDDRIYYGHAGDSRLYLYRNQVLDQMTEDHSVIQQLLKAGLISLKDAQYHPQKNEITRALGLSLSFEPEISPRAIIPQNEDYLLLCSDGLTNMVSPVEISKILDNPYNVNDKAARLVSLANKKGGNDNISVILLRFHNLGEQDDIQDEPADKPVIGIIRNLLRNQKFSYFLIFLFILGTLLMVLFHENRNKSFPVNRSIVNNQKMFTDLIIPYTQKESETIEIIAWKFNITRERIIALNPNYIQMAGTHVKIPVKSLYTYKFTDDMEMVASCFEVAVTDILKANDLCGLQPISGTELIIPLSENNE